MDNPTPYGTRAAKGLAFVIITLLPEITHAFSPTAPSLHRHSTHIHQKHLTATTTTTTTPTTTTSSTRLHASSDDKNNYLSSFFTGGAFDDEDDAAIKIASKLKTVRDLGWTNPTPRRKGSTRPRHRAFGGSTEKPLQEKAGFDESNENCPERWLTQEEFYAVAKSSGPAADAVFVALAGGGAFAERDVCETKLAGWYVNKKFNEAQFLKDVKKGRTDLALGWAVFLSVTGTSALCIVLPTNPLAKGLEALINAVLLKG